MYHMLWYITVGEDGEQIERSNKRSYLINIANGLSSLEAQSLMAGC